MQEQKRVIVPGPPGTGKTSRCLREVEHALSECVPPGRIAYVSFTRAAVHEARDRARYQFNLEREDLPFFRTLHSLAMYLLGASRGELLSRDQLRELGELLGESLDGHDSLDEAGEPRARRPGTTGLFLDQLSRTTDRRLRSVYGDLPPHDRPPWRLVERAALAYQRFREDVGALDFTDLLEQGVEHVHPPSLDLAIVDEAQDLTPLQWRFAWSALSRCSRVVISGDDRQAVFRWSGADPDVLINLEGEVNPLTQSFRLPRRIHALSERVRRTIKNQRSVDFLPREAEGEIHHHRVLGSVDLEHGDSWMLLARHGSKVNSMCRELRGRGLLYRTRRGHSVDETYRKALVAMRAWAVGDPAVGEQAREALKLILGSRNVPPELPEMVTYEHATRLGVNLGRDPEMELVDRVPRGEAVYLRRLLHNNEDPASEPRINVSTIHGAKGREADHVVLSSALNRRTSDAWFRHPDDERRVLYVGVSRARQGLHLLSAGERYAYPLAAYDTA